jgi:glutathione S-transferase
MILIGQYDSPFVRRVAIAMRLYGVAYEHRPWSVFGDADKLAAFNPLRRVPTLILDDGDVLIESAAILDWLDEQAGPRALIPRSGEARRRQLHTCALGTGLAEKAVALLYERVLHEQTSAAWTDRCGRQIGDVLTVLEKERAALASEFWFGGRMGHADIAVACALRFLREAHPNVFDPGLTPLLAAFAGICEATEPFRTVVQPLVPPK